MGHGWRRIVTLVALFSILGLLIAACGGGGGGDTGAGQGAATTAAGGAGATTEAGGAGATTEVPGEETAAPTEQPASAQTTEANETATAAEGDAEETATAAGGDADETATAAGGADETATAAGGADETATAAGGADETATAAGGADETATAAGGADTTATAAGGAAAAVAEAPACPSTAQGQQITMWSPLTGPDGKFMTDLATRFSQENEQGITVQHLPQPEYLQKLNTAAAGQALPEMTVVRADDIAEMAARNVLKPMSEEALAAVGGSDIGGQFPEQVWNVGEYRGNRLAVPLDVHPLVLYYNKDLFQQAGLEEPGTEPMTREEFEQAAEALNKDGVAGWAIGTLFSADTLFQTLVRQYGGQLYNEDGTEVAYNSEEGVRALTYIRDMKQKYTPQVAGAGDPEVKLFQQGRAGMVLHGPWHISDMQKLPFVGFAPVPQFGDEYAVWGGSHQLALTTEDPAKQAAAGCWIGWLSANSAEWAKAGQLPVRQSVLEGGQLETAAPAIAAIAAEGEAVIMPPPVPGVAGATIGEASKGIAAVLAGQQQDIQKALDDAAAKSNQILQQNAQRYGGQ